MQSATMTRDFCELFYMAIRVITLRIKKSMQWTVHNNTCSISQQSVEVAPEGRIIMAAGSRWDPYEEHKRTDLPQRVVNQLRHLSRCGESGQTSGSWMLGEM